MKQRIENRIAFGLKDTKSVVMWLARDGDDGDDCRAGFSIEDSEPGVNDFGVVELMRY